jgi:hypothetical protein
MDKRCAIAAALVLTLGLICGSSVRADVRVEFGRAAGPPGARVTVAATLRTDGEELAGIRIGIESGVAVAIASRADGGRPDCTLNPALRPGDAGAFFNWTTDGTCPGADCRVIADVLVSRGSLPDGAELFSCAIDIPAGAADGDHPLGCDVIETSDWTPDPVLPTACSGGVITVDAALPAITPSAMPPPSTPTPTASPCPSCATRVEVPVVSALPGSRVVVPVTFHLGGDDVVVGLQADLGFRPAAPIVARADGDPDCDFGPGLAGFSTIKFQPAGGEPTAVRFVIISSQLDPILDGALVGTCVIEVADDAAPGRYPFTLSRLGAADPDGQPVELAGHPGAIEVHADQGGQPVIDAGGGAVSAGGCAVVPARGAAAPLWGTALLLLVARRLRRKD